MPSCVPHLAGLDTSCSHWWIIWAILPKHWKGSGVYHVNGNEKQGGKRTHRHPERESVGEGTDASKVLSVQVPGSVDLWQCCVKFTEHEVWQKNGKITAWNDTNPASENRPLFPVSGNHYCSVFIRLIQTAIGDVVRIWLWAVLLSFLC